MAKRKGTNKQAKQMHHEKHEQLKNYAALAVVILIGIFALYGSGSFSGSAPITGFVVKAYACDTGNSCQANAECELGVCIDDEIKNEMKALSGAELVKYIKELQMQAQKEGVSPNVVKTCILENGNHAKYGSDGCHWYDKYNNEVVDLDNWCNDDPSKGQVGCCQNTAVESKFKCEGDLLFNTTVNSCYGTEKVNQFNCATDLNQWYYQNEGAYTCGEVNGKVDCYPKCDIPGTVFNSSYSVKLNTTMGALTITGASYCTENGLNVSGYYNSGSSCVTGTKLDSCVNYKDKYNDYDVYQQYECVFGKLYIQKNYDYCYKKQNEVCNNDPAKGKLGCYQ